MDILVCMKQVVEIETAKMTDDYRIDRAGSSKAVNIVLLGRLSHYFDLPEEAWLASLEANVPAKFLEMNKKAFALGKNA